MVYDFKQEMCKKERFASGHRLCAGCAASIVARSVLRQVEEEDKAAVVCATGCLQAATFPYPYVTWKDSYLHSAFENAGATISGVETAIRVLREKGRVKKTYKSIAFGGDGGTYDIGLQSLSGALERGHDMVYVCYDNEAYMNTGIQRSSSTSRFADTTTSPIGSLIPGKPQNKKNLTDIVIAHHLPYVAQTTMIGNFKDIHRKAHTAIYTEGTCFLNVLSPCPRGWRYDPSKLMGICKLAVDTCIWPLFEVINGEEYILNYEPKKKLPVEKFLRPQGRFKHVFKPGNEWMIEAYQAEVDRKWEALLAKCK